jgi:hypothetical protein
MLGKMKDFSLKESMVELEKKAKEFCEETGLEPENAIFTVRIFENLVKTWEEWNLKGIGKVIQASRELIEFNLEELEGITFIIDRFPGLTPQEYLEGEKYLEEKKEDEDIKGEIALSPSEFSEEEADKNKEDSMAAIRAKVEHIRIQNKGGKILFAKYLKADAHVRIGLFHGKYVKFICRT